MTTRRRAPRPPHLLAPALLLGAVAVTGCGQLTLGTLENTSVASYAIAVPVHAIVVTNGSGDIDLVAGGTRVAVRETRHYNSPEPRLRRSVHDGVLTLTSDCDDCSIDVRVAVPAGTDVEVETASGNVEARGIDVPSADLASHSGDVNAKLAGHQRVLAAHTDSGNVDATAASAREIDATTHSGNVSVDAARAPRSTRAQTDSGSVAVTVPRGTYAVDAGTMSGSSSVDGLVSDDRAPRSISAASMSGDVHVRAR